MICASSYLSSSSVIASDELHRTLSTRLIKFTRNSRDKTCTTQNFSKKDVKVGNKQTIRHAVAIATYPNFENKNTQQNAKQ